MVLEITNRGNALSRLDDDEKMNVRLTDFQSKGRGGEGLNHSTKNQIVMRFQIVCPAMHQ
jgi:hypothetical protein